MAPKWRGRERRKWDGNYRYRREGREKLQKWRSERGEEGKGGKENTETESEISKSDRMGERRDLFKNGRPDSGERHREGEGERESERERGGRGQKDTDIKTKRDCGEKNKDLIQQPLSVWERETHTHTLLNVGSLCSGGAEAGSCDRSPRWTSEVNLEKETLQNTRLQTREIKTKAEKKKKKSAILRGSSPSTAGLLYTLEDYLFSWGFFCFAVLFSFFFHFCSVVNRRYNSFFNNFSISFIYFPVFFSPLNRFPLLHRPAWSDWKFIQIRLFWLRWLYEAFITVIDKGIRGSMEYRLCQGYWEETE